MRSVGRLAMPVVLMIAAIVPLSGSPKPSVAGNAAPAWVAGDAHTHAAGDSGLAPHIRCREIRGGLDGCAEHLVRETLQRAKDNGAAWVIYTEHGPWLGLKPTQRTFCAPPFGRPCKTVPWAEHDAEQARRQWTAINAAARKLAPEFGVRSLMGQELGTASQVTIPVTYLKRLPGDLSLPGDCPGVEAGHFGVYYTPRLLDDTLFDCNESRYLRTLAAADAWGAVNHPDNPDGGSRWFCWNTGDVSPADNTIGPDTGGGSRCETGVYENQAAVRAIELVSDHNLPSDVSLRRLDALLLQGRRIALTGGGDSHTSMPVRQEDHSVRLGPLRIPIPFWHAQEPGNDGKVGLAGRTYIPAEGVAPSAGFNPIDPSDPVREAIKSGRTVASTGPLALPTVDGKGPGETVDVNGGRFDVRIDFAPASVVAGDLARPGQRQQTQQVTFDGDGKSAGASRVNIVIGRTGACTPDENMLNAPCLSAGDNLSVVRHQVTEAERGQGYAMVPVVIPADFTHGYMRTETLFAPRTSDQRFQESNKYSHGAFASPIYLRQQIGGAPRTGTYELNRLIARASGFEVRLTRMVVTASAIRVEIEYRNIGFGERSIVCPRPTDARVIFAKEIIEADDGFCARRVGAVIPVAAGQTHNSWGSFPVRGHGGETFSLRWWVDSWPPLSGSNDILLPSAVQ